MNAEAFLNALYDLWAREKGIQIEIDIQKKPQNAYNKM